MGDVRWLLAASVALLTLEAVFCSPRIADSQYVYRYLENGRTCIYASFKMSFDIYYDDGSISNSPPPYKLLWLPNNTEVNVTGKCDNSEPEMTLHWKNNNSLMMSFGSAKDKWELQQLSLVFNLSADVFNLTEGKGLQTFLTNGSDLFLRTFKDDEYFYCKNCKTYEFGQYNESICGHECQEPCIDYIDYTSKDNKSTEYCSSVHMEKSVIYIGGDPSDAKKRLCLEDYIELQEIIVPVAVGGVLGLLLVLIFVSYIIAYIRRRRREAKSQYEPVGEF